MSTLSEKIENNLERFIYEQNTFMTRQYIKYVVIETIHNHYELQLNNFIIMENHITIPDNNDTSSINIELSEYLKLILRELDNNKPIERILRELDRENKEVKKQLDEYNI
jgi:hypothetical protein